MEHTYSAIKNFLRFNGRIFIVSMKQHLCYCETEVQNRPLKRRVCVSGEIYEKISPKMKKFPHPSARGRTKKILHLCSEIKRLVSRHRPSETGFNKKIQIYFMIFLHYFFLKPHQLIS
jgi:hypothetical protein